MGRATAPIPVIAFSLTNVFARAEVIAGKPRFYRFL